MCDLDLVVGHGPEELQQALQTNNPRLHAVLLISHFGADDEAAALRARVFQKRLAFLSLKPAMEPALGHVPVSLRKYPMRGTSVRNVKRAECAALPDKALMADLPDLAFGHHHDLLA